VPSPDFENSTRQRLLQAAGETFAEKGFHAATIRDISQRADANVAAVNYYFGDKQKLYEAVLLDAINYGERRFAAVRDQMKSLGPRQCLHDFVGSALIAGLGPDRPEWHCKLLCIEMADPGPALETLFDKTLSQRFAMLRQIISELLSPPGDAREISLCACSVLGQCLFYLRSPHLLPQIWPDMELNCDGLEQLTRHITEFSLAAIEVRNSRASDTD
jgi:TetR/AcrR family transcriptional regulator, regulator of cefoperazone and chloramphenicol sensitivity